MLPSYISYQLEADKKTSALWNGSRRRTVLNGIALGFAVTLGFITVFVILGIIAGLIAQSVAAYAVYVSISIGMVLIVLGFLRIANVPVGVAFPALLPQRASAVGTFLYGVAYAVASIGCSLPIFLMVLFASLATGGMLITVYVFLAYSLGAAALMIPLTILLAISKKFTFARLHRYSISLRWTSGILIAAAGMYLVYTQGILLRATL